MSKYCNLSIQGELTKIKGIVLTSKYWGCQNSQLENSPTFQLFNAPFSNFIHSLYLVMEASIYFRTFSVLGYKVT